MKTMTLTFLFNNGVEKTYAVKSNPETTDEKLNEMAGQVEQLFKNAMKDKDPGSFSIGTPWNSKLIIDVSQVTAVEIKIKEC